MNYELIETEGNSVIKATSSDGKISWIPIDPGNSDYQAYLAWVAEGNEAEETE
jgi:hypothetical protein